MWADLAWDEGADLDLCLFPVIVLVLLRVVLVIIIVHLVLIIILTLELSSELSVDLFRRRGCLACLAHFAEVGHELIVELILVSFTATCPILVAVNLAVVVLSIFVATVTPVPSLGGSIEEGGAGSEVLHLEHAALVACRLALIVLEGDVCDLDTDFLRDQGVCMRASKGEAEYAAVVQYRDC